MNRPQNDTEYHDYVDRLRKKYEQEEEPVPGLKFDQGKQPWFALPLEVLQPLADVFAAGEKKYATFNCLQPFTDPERRFYDGMMRHIVECQRDPLAVDEELKEKYGIIVYHQAQIAFNALMRLYHARQEKP